MINRRTGLAGIEEKLNVRLELSSKGNYRYENSYKVYRLENNSYIFDGVMSRDELIAECNK